MKNMSLRDFYKYWMQRVSTDIREAVKQPGTEKFTLEEMTARLLVELATDPIAKNFSLPELARFIVQKADRARRPDFRDKQGDLFNNEHKWIPLDEGVRVRYCDAWHYDLTVYLGIVNDQAIKQSSAAARKVRAIQQDMQLLLKTGTSRVGDAWRQEYGWEPSADEGDDDDDDGGEDE